MDYLDLLGNPAYRHMLLNHIPIIGLALALVVLLAGLAWRQNALLFTGLVLVAIASGCSIVVAHYGDAAYTAIYDTLDGAGRKWLDYHAELAQTWLPVLIANAVLAVLATALGMARRRLLPWAAVAVALATLAAIGAAGIVARAGGQIQHPEFRISDPPVVESRRETR
jgi:hypothetical protein